METTIEKKPLEYYLSLKYPVTLHPSPEGGYAVEMEDLPGCISQGETVEDALEMIEDARRLWIGVAYEDGQDIPEPRGEQEYSGKFFIRAPRSLHRKLDQMAKREGVSLNQFLVSTLAHSIGMKEARSAKPSRKGKISKN